MSNETKEILRAIPAAITVLMGLGYLFLGILSAPMWFFWPFIAGVIYTAIQWDKINDEEDYDEPTNVSTTSTYHGKN